MSSNQCPGWRIPYAASQPCLCNNQVGYSLVKSNSSLQGQCRMPMRAHNACLQIELSDAATEHRVRCHKDHAKRRITAFTILVLLCFRIIENYMGAGAKQRLNSSVYAYHGKHRANRSDPTSPSLVNLSSIVSSLSCCYYFVPEAEVLGDDFHPPLDHPDTLVVNPHQASYDSECVYGYGFSLAVGGEQPPSNFTSYFSFLCRRSCSCRSFPTTNGTANTPKLHQALNHHS